MVLVWSSIVPFIINLSAFDAWTISHAILDTRFTCYSRTLNCRTTFSASSVSSNRSSAPNLARSWQRVFRSWIWANDLIRHGWHLFTRTFFALFVHCDSLRTVSRFQSVCTENRLGISTYTVCTTAFQSTGSLNLSGESDLEWVSMAGELIPFEFLLSPSTLSSLRHFSSDVLLVLFWLRLHISYGELFEFITICCSSYDFLSLVYLYSIFITFLCAFSRFPNHVFFLSRRASLPTVVLFSHLHFHKSSTTP